MKHYALDQWADFGRGLVGAEDGIRMRNHLAEGCTSCRQEANFCLQLKNVCQRLKSQQVPEAVVRLARAIFPVQSPGPKRGTRLPVELIYDSFLVPATAGFRSTWQVGWQGL